MECTEIPWLLQDVLCEQSVTSTLHVADAFGNAVLTGGANVTAQLQTKGGTVLSEVSFICSSFSNKVLRLLEHYTLKIVLQFIGFVTELQHRCPRSAQTYCYLDYTYNYVPNAPIKVYLPFIMGEQQHD